MTRENDSIYCKVSDKTVVITTVNELAHHYRVTAANTVTHSQPTQYTRTSFHSRTVTKHQNKT